MRSMDKANNKIYLFIILSLLIHLLLFIFIYFIPVSIPTKKPKSKYLDVDYIKMPSKKKKLNNDHKEATKKLDEPSKKIVSDSELKPLEIPQKAKLSAWKENLRPEKKTPKKVTEKLTPKKNVKEENHEPRTNDQEQEIKNEEPKTENQEQDEKGLNLTKVFSELDKYVKEDKFKSEHFSEVGGGAVSFEKDFPSCIWYGREIKNKVVNAWSKPYMARLGASGISIIKFVINKDGSINDLYIYESAGHSSLDSAAMNAIRSAQPFSPLPDDYEYEKLGVTFSFWYNIRPKN
ncbi:MAG: TonB family protein [bacterium]